MADDHLPYDLEGLLALLERLDGAEEAAVVRSALEAGVPRDRVMDELAARGHAPARPPRRALTFRQ